MHRPEQANTTLRALAWTTAGCAAATLITAAMFWVFRDTNFWAGFEPARAFLAPGPSERLYIESIFRTRANTWSNLPYAYVGIWALVMAVLDSRQRDRGNYVRAYPWTGAFYGLSCVYLGIGSGIFHASLTRWGQQLDVAAMYSTLVAAIAIALGRLWPTGPSGRPTWPIWIALAIVVNVLLYVYKWSMSSGVVLPTLIATVLAFGIWDCYARRSEVQVRWLVAGFASQAVAVACRGLDRIEPLSSPEVWLKGHALWHCFSAGALACLYAYIRAERRVYPPTR